jgi:UrcA family protein
LNQVTQLIAFCAYVSVKFFACVLPFDTGHVRNIRHKLQIQSDKEKSMKYIRTFIIVAFATTVSSAAFADTTSIRVDYSDLNLSSPSGQQALNTRITRAARNVCGDSYGAMSLRETRLVQACVSKARHEAAASVKARGSVELVSR